MAAPCGNKTSRGHACYPLTTYCPNRPATYKRDTTGRPAKSAIYKPDTQPKPRPHAYTHACTGTPARLHPRLHRHTRTPTTTQVPLPAPPYAHDRARTGKIASHERKGASKAPKTGRIIPPSAHNPCFSTIQAICAPQQHPCATSDMHTHANTSTHTETQHVPQAHKHHAPHTEHDQTHTPAHRRSDVTGLRRR